MQLQALDTAGESWQEEEGFWGQQTGATPVMFVQDSSTSTYRFSSNPISKQLLGHHRSPPAQLIPGTTGLAPSTGWVPRAAGHSCDGEDEQSPRADTSQGCAVRPCHPPKPST